MTSWVVSEPTATITGVAACAVGARVTRKAAELASATPAASPRVRRDFFTLVLSMSVLVRSMRMRLHSLRHDRRDSAGAVLSCRGEPERRRQETSGEEVTLPRRTVSRRRRHDRTTGAPKTPAQQGSRLQPDVKVAAGQVTSRPAGAGCRPRPAAPRTRSAEGSSGGRRCGRSSGGRGRPRPPRWRRAPAGRARPAARADGSPDRPVWLSVRPPWGVGGKGLPSSSATTTTAFDEFHGTARVGGQQREPVVVGRTEQRLGVDGRRPRRRRSRCRPWR